LYSADRRRDPAQPIFLSRKNPESEIRKIQKSKAEGNSKPENQKAKEFDRGLPGFHRLFLGGSKLEEAQICNLLYRQNCILRIVGNTLRNQIFPSQKIRSEIRNPKEFRNPNPRNLIFEAPPAGEPPGF
jgi:hypothetical protein